MALMVPDRTTNLASRLVNQRVQDTKEIQSIVQKQHRLKRGNFTREPCTRTSDDIA